MKSIFRKMFIRYMLIVVLSFLLLIFFSHNKMSNIAKEQVENSFSLYGEQIYTYIYTNKVELFNNKNNEAYDKLKEFIKKISLISNCSVWVCYDEGSLLSFSDDSIDERFFNYSETDNRIHLNIKNHYELLLDDTSNLKTSNIFANIVNDNSEINKTYTANYNLLVFNNYPPIEINMIIYFHTPINVINKYRDEITYSYIFPLIASLSISIILVGLLSINISKPIVALNRVANLVRSGDYKKRVSISKRNDEIGDLAINFNLMIDEIDELDKSRLSFISDMSHELRTPMTTINGFITGIIDGTIPVNKQEYYLNLVKDEIGRLNRLVNNLLLLSKIESEEVKLEKTDFDINALIDKTLANFENIIKEKSIKINIHFDEKTTFVNANEDDIERVLFNLLHNAIKFSFKRGQIKIYTKINKNITVYIEDSGVGINQNELISIWNRFYKADKSRSADVTGTGLGLSIVKKILNNHNENVFVKSKVNEGSVFSFTLTLSENL